MNLKWNVSIFKLFSSKCYKYLVSHNINQACPISRKIEDVGERKRSERERERKIERERGAKSVEAEEKIAKDNKAQRIERKIKSKS